MKFSNVLLRWKMMVLWVFIVIGIFLWRPAKDHAETCNIKVSSSAELKTALRHAQPGQVICLASGIYSGKFVINRSGTPKRPIVLKGPAGAICDAGSTATGYVLHLNGAEYWHLKGFTVRNGKKRTFCEGRVCGCQRRNIIWNDSRKHI